MAPPVRRGTPRGERSTTGIGTHDCSAGTRIANRPFAPGESLHAPHLLDLGVVQVLRRCVLAGEVPLTRAREGLEDFADLPLSRYPHDRFLPRTWELRRNATAYDATYLALAEDLDAPLLSLDASLRPAPWRRARVELV